MTGAAKRYRELLTELLLERQLAGGSLPEEIESRRVEELDRCWWAMTEAEQQEVERTLADEGHVEAPPDLGVRDVRVEQGRHDPPRRAA